MKKGQCSKQLLLRLIYSLALDFLESSLPTAFASPFILNRDARSNEGAQISIFIGQVLKNNFPDIEKQYDRYLAFLLSPVQFKQLFPKIQALKEVLVSDVAAIMPDHTNTHQAIFNEDTLQTIIFTPQR